MSRAQDDAWPLVLPGDIVLCRSTGSMLSGAIRGVTRSPYSHAQLVMRPAPNPWRDPLQFAVLEVGWTIRETRFAGLGRGDFAVWRPIVEGVDTLPSRLGWGLHVAADVRALIQAPSFPRRYPWWKLGAYLFPLDWREQLLRAGPRQVCSVMAARALVSHGWRPRFNGKPVADDRTVLLLTPGDLARACERDAGRLIYREV